MKTTLLLWGFILLSFSRLSAQSPGQSVINSSGNTYRGGGYQVDWSIGETALVTGMYAANGQLIVTNGFLQPQAPAALDQHRYFQPDEVRVLPSPTYDVVEINLLTYQQGRVSLEVYDAAGKVLIQRTLVNPGFGHLERISLGAYAAGTYILRIHLIPEQGFTRKTGSYKIVKL